MGIWGSGWEIITFIKILLLSSNGFLRQVKTNGFFKKFGEILTAKLSKILPGKIMTWFEDHTFLRFFKNTSILFSGNVFASLLKLIAFALTARALGAALFGILALIQAYVSVVDRLVNFQSWQALIKYGAKSLENNDIEDFKQIIKFGFILDISTAILGTLIAISAVHLTGNLQNWDPQTINMAFIYSLVILFHISGTPTAILRLFDRFKFFALREIIAGSVKLIGVIVAYWSGAGILLFVLIWALTDIVSHLLLLTFGLIVLNLNGITISDIITINISKISTRFKGIWSFVITTNLSTSVRMASREVDMLIIGGLLGPAPVGLYKVAKEFAKNINKITDPMYQAIYPELARLWEGNQVKGFLDIFYRSSLIAGTIAFSCWILVVFWGEYFISLVVGVQYIEAKPVLVWYLFAIVIAVFSLPFQPSMLALGKAKVSFFILSCSTLLYFAVMFPLINYFEIIGAGIAYVIFYLCWSLFMGFYIYFFLRQKIG